MFRVGNLSQPLSKAQKFQNVKIWFFQIKTFMWKTNQKTNTSINQKTLTANIKTEQKKQNTTVVL